MTPPEHTRPPLTPTSQLLSLGDTPTLIVLSALTLTVEDCTDSDFNTKVSTSRRNDVLQGLNELAPTLLPAIFNVAQTQYNKLLANKADPAPLKQLTELLSLLHTFCIWMPVEWADSPTHDFISVFLHLLRESTGNLNVKAATCLDALCGRRTDNNLYARLIVDLPKSIAEANACNPTDDLVKLTLALDFHRTVSSSLAHLLQANIHKITDDKSIVAPKISQPSQSLTNLKTYLQLMCEMLQVSAECCQAISEPSEARRASASRWTSDSERAIRFSPNGAPARCALFTHAFGRLPNVADKGAAAPVPHHRLDSDQHVGVPLARSADR